MSINKFTKLALKALSYPHIDVCTRYKIDRFLSCIPSPADAFNQFGFSEKMIKAGGRSILLRIYPYKDGNVSNTLLFFHGGGWIFENSATYHSVCRNLSMNTHSNIVSVGYSLAPEKCFPNAVMDCYCTARYLIAEKPSLGIRLDNITLIGDSAGGNLAAAVSLMARDRGEFAVERQILVYPATYFDHSEVSPFKSVRENGTDYLLTSKDLCDYMKMYRGSLENLKSPYFAPLTASDFSNQPKTLIITAQYDPLRDEGEEYGRRLRDAGADVYIYRMADALHGFFSLSPRYVHVKKAYKLINNFLYNNNIENG